MRHWVLFPTLHKTSHGTHISTQEVEAEGSEMQDHPYCTLNWRTALGHMKRKKERRRAVSIAKYYMLPFTTGWALSWTFDIHLLIHLIFALTLWDRVVGDYYRYYYYSVCVCPEDNLQVVGSLLPLCGCWGSNTACQAQQQHLYPLSHCTDQHCILSSFYRAEMEA